VVFPTLWVESFKEEERGLRKNLDFLEGRKAEAHIWTLAYRKAITKLYNRKVRPHHVQ
ncbi:hypothetical protein B296_00021100, partial [Ensete ventricosum]